MKVGQTSSVCLKKVHPGYMQSVKEKYPDLTNAELRLLMLEKLDLSTQEMANMIGVNKNTIHQTRLRLRKKPWIEIKRSL
jgi:DNA-binding CsgD family transcriptional regulator